MIKYNFAEKALLKNSKVNVLGNYICSSEKIEVCCKKCGYIWGMLPSNILKNRGCPICARNCTKSHDTFIREMRSINVDIEILSEYQQSHKKVDCRCNKCGYRWSMTPTHLLDGHGCPMCLTSTGENKVKSFLITLNIGFEQQKTFDNLYGVKGGKLSFDFYLPKYNALIEYQGRQHYEPSGYMGGVEKFKYQIQNDDIKRRYVKDKGYLLLEISYKDNVKEKILSFLKTVTTTGGQ